MLSPSCVYWIPKGIVNSCLLPVECKHLEGRSHPVGFIHCGILGTRQCTWHIGVTPCSLIEWTHTIHFVASFLLKNANLFQFDWYQKEKLEQKVNLCLPTGNSNLSILKEISPGCSLGRTDAKAETPILWPPHAKSWLTGKDSDAGRDWGQEEKGTTEDDMAGWHHQLDGHEFEWTPGVGDGQGGLACCDSWGPKESDTTEWLNWTDM